MMASRTSRALLVVWLLSLLAACGGGSDGGAPADAEPKVTGVELPRKLTVLTVK